MSLEAAWRGLTVLPLGADTNGLYPIPEKSKIGFRLTENETVQEKHEFGLITVYLVTNGEGSQVFSSTGNKGLMVLTNHRIVYVFEKVPKNRSMFVPIALAQSIAGASKHKGEAMVGHVRYSWISAISARPRSLGLNDSQGMMRVQANLRTGDSIIIEVNKDKAPAIATTLCTLAIGARLSGAESVVDAETSARLARAASTPFKPEPKVFERKDLVGALPAGS
jgi:hypothetical protein